MIYGIKIGEAALINVTIQASPAPTVEWVVAGERINEGNYGRLQTYPVTPLVSIMFELFFCIHREKYKGEYYFAGKRFLQCNIGYLDG